MGENLQVDIEVGVIIGNLIEGKQTNPGTYPDIYCGVKADV